MAFAHGKGTRILVGELAASSGLNSIQISNSRALADNMACFGDDGERFIPGLRSGALSLEGPFEDGGLRDAILAAEGSDNGLLITAAPAGFAVAMPVATAISDLETHENTAAVDDAVRLTVEATADEMVDLGASLHNLVAETATANGTTVDGGASSANGGVAVLHVTAYTGLTDVDVVVQHSTNGTVWATLATFTTVTDVTSERVMVAGTVNRYLRAAWTATGTGSITFVAAFARR